MSENLVIVESPAKAKTIEKFLGKEYLVKSSFGHIRDLVKKNFGVDLEHDYQPQYAISEGKEAIVAELRKHSKTAKTIWLASDEDREGEAIAWHLQEALKLDPKKTKRIVFHEITKDAILNAIQHPRSVDINLVNAQQARRVLDRLVGYELSPLLWRKIKASLSAGRVQSVAVRLIVDREREILVFSVESFFRVAGIFLAGKTSLKADVPQKFGDEKAALTLLKKCTNATFTVESVEKKPAKRSPTAPFTTSTLQQEASRKLGFSVRQTMAVAQRLYEEGYITYMRTDSVNLSEQAIASAKEAILKMYGEKYLHTRRYTTKTKGAQEAHEAIRPSYMSNPTIDAGSQEKRLYELIWKRTIASQMSEAMLERTIVTIGVSGAAEKFVANGEVMLFDGFLKVYMESQDDESEGDSAGLLPPMQVGQTLQSSSIVATERFTQRPPRYTEATLVKKLEELGIGRPSTYAPTISTIVARGYVIKEDREGQVRSYKQHTLTSGKITEKILTEITGAERAKLFPSDMGMVVTDYLVEHFPKVLDFSFTAKVEEEFDEIADGKIVWNKMIDDFYQLFHVQVEDALQNSQRATAERKLGVDPKTGKEVIVRIGRFGPLAQLGEGEGDQKPQYANLQKGQLIETITLEEALKLFELPRTLGDYEGKPMTVAVGRFGPYVRHDDKYASLKRNVDNPMTIALERGIELIEEKRRMEREKVIKTFAENEELQVLNGRFGPYLSCGERNFKLPKDIVPSELTYEQCVEIMSQQEGSTPRKSRFAKKTAAAKSTVKKTSAAKATAAKPAAKKTATAKATAAKPAAKKAATTKATAAKSAKTEKAKTTKKATAKKKIS
ncbi:MAG: type I DNA topoisomerase [Prevotellaceae bacterium]|jgi:DNA topoisomerase-1|nr:type I DNA topoisomerase [Prevotellaceae bacterium]